MKKIYKATRHIAFDEINNGNTRLRDEISKTIQENQSLGLTTEVQYSTCATANTVIYSALILGYTEE